MNQEPHIKIIPPNPFVNSILIVYCHINNKTIQCQSKWTRIQSSSQQTLQNRNSRNQMNIQNGNTYKCTSLDYNHIIQVQASCQYMGKQFKLTARTQLVKITKQLQQRKLQRKWILCKIQNSNQSIQCQINLDINKVLQLICGTKQFNLQLNPCYVNVVSNYSFKAAILIHRYEFLTFFQESSLTNKQPNQGTLSLCNTFEFIFHSEFDRDLTLLKIAQNNTIIQSPNLINLNNNKQSSNSIMNNNSFIQTQQYYYKQPANTYIQNLNNNNKLNSPSQNYSGNATYNKNNISTNNIINPNSQYNNNNITPQLTKLQIKSNHKIQNQPINSNNSNNTLQFNSQNFILDDSNSNKIKTKRSINQLKKHHSNNSNNQVLKTGQNSKREGIGKSKTPDSKQVNNIFYHEFFSPTTTNGNNNNSNNNNNNNSGRKKNEKIKITEKLSNKKMNLENNSLMNEKNKSSSHSIRIKEQQVLIIESHTTPNNFSAKKNHVQKKNSNQQFLNIFDQDDGTVSQPQIQKMQHSQPNYFIQNSSKHRPVTNYKQAQVSKQDLPSINLRGSFQQLQKYVPPDVGSNKKVKQKLKTQINRGNFSYQYPKHRQKTQNSQKQIPKSSTKQIQQNQQPIQSKNQLSQLKKQNSQLRKQLQNMYAIAKQNNSLKKKYLQLNEQVNRLELERKQILADKLKCEANYHKQKIQKQQLKNQLEDLLKMLQTGNFVNVQDKANNGGGNNRDNFKFGINNYLNNNSSLLNLNQQNTNQFQQSDTYNNSLSYQQNRKKINSIISNPTLKKNYLNQFRQKNITSNKPISSNHSLIQNNQKDRTFDSNTPSNTQSRKQLKFPAYNYKFNSNMANGNNK